MAYALGERLVLGHSLVELLALIGTRSPDGEALREMAGILDQYYVPTRYPNGLPGGVPFEAFGEAQAAAAVEGAERFAALARQQIGN